MKGSDKMKKKHLILKLLFILIIIFGILIYAYNFPVTMELLDENANRLLDFLKIDFECNLFGKISEIADAWIITSGSAASMILPMSSRDAPRKEGAAMTGSFARMR